MTLRPLCSAPGCDCPASLELVTYPIDAHFAVCMFHQRSYLMAVLAAIDRISARTGMVHLDWRTGGVATETEAIRGDHA